MRIEARACFLDNKGQPHLTFNEARNASVSHIIEGFMPKNPYFMSSGYGIIDIVSKNWDKIIDEVNKL